MTSNTFSNLNPIIRLINHLEIKKMAYTLKKIFVWMGLRRAESSMTSFVSLCLNFVNFVIIILNKFLLKKITIKWRKNWLRHVILNFWFKFFFCWLTNLNKIATILLLNCVWKKRVGRCDNFNEYFFFYYNLIALFRRSLLSENISIICYYNFKYSINRILC